MLDAASENDLRRTALPDSLKADKTDDSSVQRHGIDYDHCCERDRHQSTSGIMDEVVGEGGLAS